jgi:hypothetical protein
MKLIFLSDKVYDQVCEKISKKFPKLNLGQSQMTKNQGPYSSHFIFYVTYKWAQKSRVSHYTKHKRFAIDKYSCLLGPFVSYNKRK